MGTRGFFIPANGLKKRVGQYAITLTLFKAVPRVFPMFPFIRDVFQTKDYEPFRWKYVLR